MPGRILQPGESWRFVAMCPPATKKTSNQLARVRGRHRILPSKTFIRFSKFATEVFRYQMLGNLYQRIEGPVHVLALFYRKTNTTGDLVGYQQALGDVLQSDVLKNDRQIASWDGSRLLIDKARPRVEFWIARHEPGVAKMPS